MPGNGRAVPYAGTGRHRAHVGASLSPATVPLLDLRAQHAPLGDALRSAAERVCDSQQFILGPEVSALETELAAFVGSRFAVGVSSGSDALLCALLALGVEPGDEVVTTPFSFIATAEAIVRCGATPRFVDIQPDTFNLNPAALAATLNGRTRAVIPVHLFGHPARMDLIREICAARGVAVVEDAAQAFGGAYQGRRLGAWGNLGCYSFFPSKPLGGWGDGGMIVTDDAALAERCRELRQHGTRDKHTFTRVGGNFRLDALQAAILRVKLPHVERWRDARAAHARAYRDALKPIDQLAVPPASDAPSNSAHAHYTLRVLQGGRAALAEYLRARGVETAIYYSTPLHLQPCFEQLGLTRGALPESERASDEALSIPLYAEMSVEQRDHVIASIHAFFETENLR
ncbi:MAG TPA: DegT/DnrJ/EryC1/StrS family aminotransferase [Polyangiaceae bacterium]